MTCKHSFQGNYSGDVIVKYEIIKEGGGDKAFIRGNEDWIPICSDMETHGEIQIYDLRASCSMYLPNWMNGRRKSFIWNFKTKEVYFQSLSKVWNDQAKLMDWQWRYSVGKVGAEDWEVLKGWEIDGVIYDKKGCVS